MSVRNEANQEAKLETASVTTHPSRARFASDSARAAAKRRHRNKTIAFVLIVGAVLLLDLALFLGAIWVLVTNIIDINQNGAEFWNVTWAVLASLIILATIFRPRKK